MAEHDPRARRDACPPTPLLLTHGGSDTVVDPGLAALDLAELRSVYTASPARLAALRMDEMGHEMTAEPVRAGAEWLRRWLPARPGPGERARE